MLHRFFENDKNYYLTLFSCTRFWRLTHHFYLLIISNVKSVLPSITNGLLFWFVNVTIVSSNSISSKLLQPPQDFFYILSTFSTFFISLLIFFVLPNNFIASSVCNPSLCPSFILDPNLLLILLLYIWIWLVCNGLFMVYTI